MFDSPAFVFFGYKSADNQFSRMFANISKIRFNLTCYIKQGHVRIFIQNQQDFNSIMVRDTLTYFFHFLDV